MLEIADIFLVDTAAKSAYNTDMDAKFNVFLDLEETVINNWDEGLLVNATRVREFLSEQGVKEFTVFSFAVWNDKDKADFERLHRRVLEKALDCRVVACPSVEDFMRVDTELTGVHFESLTDFISVRGKVGAFTNWCRFHSLNRALLVDDVVPNVDILNRDTGDLVRFVNVMDL